MRVVLSSFVLVSSSILAAARGLRTDQCEKPCTRELLFHCGSDGVTYANQCRFEIAKCLNPTLTVVSVGAPCHGASMTGLGSDTRRGGGLSLGGGDREGLSLGGGDREGLSLGGGDREGLSIGGGDREGLSIGGGDREGLSIGGDGESRRDGGLLAGRSGGDAQRLGNYAKASGLGGRHPATMSGPSQHGEATTCETGCSAWFDGCNMCQCAEDGAIMTCTTKDCDPYAEPECREWFDDSGDLGGLSAHRAGLGLRNSAPSCPPGCTSWFDGCNTCLCKGGEVKLCTMMHCDRPMGPQKCLDDETAP